MPGVCLMVWVVGLGTYDPEFKSYLAVELIPGGVDSTCHPVRVATRPGLCPIAKKTALAAPTLCTEYDPDGWLVEWMVGWWSNPLVPMFH